LTVKDLMNPRVVSVKEDDTLRHAVRVMRRHQIDGIPVVSDDETLIGMITAHDIIIEMLPTLEEMKRGEGAPGQFHFMKERARALGARKVRELMSVNLVTVSEETSASKAASRLILGRFKRLPVVCDRKLVGIISRMDICKALLDGEDLLADIPTAAGAALSAESPPSFLAN